MTVHVTDDSLDGQIYDIEIYFADQNPPWTSGTGTNAPPGWVAEPIYDANNNLVGIRFVTKTHPLRTCEPAQFQFRMEGTLGDVIIFQLTDKNHKTIGWATSYRQTLNQYGHLWLPLPGALTCTQNRPS